MRLAACGRNRSLKAAALSARQRILQTLGIGLDDAPAVRALIAANPRQLVWGTDWPHLVHFHGPQGDAAPAAAFRPVSEKALMASLAEWAGTNETLRAILVDNPARLYRF